MNDIQCWALSPAALRCLTGRDTVDVTWFQWSCAVRDGAALDRIRRLDLADREALDEWITRVSREAITPLLVLHEDDTLPGLPDWPSHWDALATLRVGDTVPESKRWVLAALAMPDPDYLEAWARFVSGPGRREGSPVCGWPELGVAYAGAVEQWLDRDRPHAKAICEQLGIELDAWSGPPLRFEHFHAVPRPDGSGMAIDLVTHPGAGAVKKMQGWRATGLMPPIEKWDPYNELREEFDFMLSLWNKAPLSDRVAGHTPMTTDTMPTAAQTWTLRALSSDRWVLKVNPPRRNGDRNSLPAVLSYVGDGPPPDGDALELAFVCIDRNEHWTQPQRRLTLLLTPTPRTRDSVRCARNDRRWEFDLPARRLVEPAEMRAPSIVCLGIEVRPAGG